MRSVRLTISNIFRLCLVLAATGFHLASDAQENSPFGRYGLGEYYSNQHTVSRALGGLSAAYADGQMNGAANSRQTVNFNNPATYSSLYFSTLDIGTVIDSRTLYSKNPTGKFSSAYFVPTYVALGVPLDRVKKLGLAFGLRPVTRINYSIHNLSRTAGDSLEALYQGSGGLTQAFVGIGKRWKAFSIGINTGYNFGRKEITTEKNFINDSIIYNSSKSSSVTTFGGIFLNGGIQYDLLLATRVNPDKTRDMYRLRFGATGTLQQTMNGSQSIERQTFVTSTDGEVKVDSVFSQDGIKGKVVLPSSYAIGLTLHKSREDALEFWSIGMEYTASKWSNYRFFGQPDAVTDTWQFKTGIQFSPDPLAARGYWNHVIYRAGFYMGKDYLNPDGNGLKQFGVSFGAGFPIRNWSSYSTESTVVNTTLQFGKRGSNVNNVTENYFQLSVGFSMSDTWFIKRRYD